MEPEEVESPEKQARYQRTKGMVIILLLLCFMYVANFILPPLLSTIDWRPKKGLLGTIASMLSTEDAGYKLIGCAAWLLPVGLGVTLVIQKVKKPFRKKEE